MKGFSRYFQQAGGLLKMDGSNIYKGLSDVTIKRRFTGFKKSVNDDSTFLDHTVRMTEEVLAMKLGVPAFKIRKQVSMTLAHDQSQSLCADFGLVIMYSGRPDTSAMQKRCCIAHELAHALLEHDTDEAIHDEQEKGRQESDAWYLAALILDDSYRLRHSKEYIESHEKDPKEIRKVIKEEIYPRYNRH